MMNHLQQRHRSTTTSKLRLDTPVEKKIKRKIKRYAEVLEVLDKATNNCKASIRKLNAAQLSTLVIQPEMTLDKLHKTRCNLRRANNRNARIYEEPHSRQDSILLRTERSAHPPRLQETSITEEGEVESFTIEDLHASGESDRASLIKNTALLETLQEDECREDAEDEATDNFPAVLQIKSRKREKSKQAAKAVTSDAQSKTGVGEPDIALPLRGYIQVCLGCGMVARAHNTLMYYRKNGSNHPNSTKVRDVTVYNLLLSAHAATANITKIKDLLRILKDDSIRPIPQTYASMFESFGRLSKPEREKEYFATMRLEMEAEGLTFDDVMKKAKFTRDQREYTLKGIKRLQPDFQPTASVPDYSYECHLLNAIDHSRTSAKTNVAENLITVAELREKFAEQLSSEISGEVSVKSIDPKDELKPSVRFSRKIVTELEKTWTAMALKAFNRKLTALKHNEQSQVAQSLRLFPYLCVLEPEEYVKTIIRDIRLLAEGSETYSLALAWLYRDAGLRINKKFEILELRRCGVMGQIEKAYMKYCEWYTKRDDGANSRIAWDNITREIEMDGASLDLGHTRWSPAVCTAVGKFLYDIILMDIKLDVNCIRANSKEKHYLPAFYTLFRFQAKIMKEEIKPHPVLSKLYRESQPEHLTFLTTMVPTVCPPKPWTSIQNGGYLVSRTEVIRDPFKSESPSHRLHSVSTKKLWPALDSLNQLASVPWSVNTAILDIIIELFRNGGSTKLNVPQPPSSLPPIPLLQPDADKAERTKVAKARMELRRRKGELYSLWCDSLYRLSLANHFRDKLFWLPHNMDFRGRVYPIPPHLNHLGSDLARSLLVFGFGKPLGPQGFDWLKIHVINLTGFKKRESLDERLKYANENMSKIIDSAEKPLTGEMWWTTSDEPWQTLAACMEIAKVVKSGDPENYICSFPVHQDGSCNGLQHYAALGRDQIGAENVNLHPSEKPQDVYSGVAAMVDSIRARDAANGVEIAQVLEGFIKRKVIKQTVMTTVYGVTRFGARLQIARQLKDMEDFPQNYVWPASMYLMKTTFESLGTMFESAREIQDWFSECARLISITRGRYLEWVTPLGLPIVQPYNKQFRVIGTKKAKMFTRGPDTVKQKNAFPPNFVHSLDSSHMMLTSLHCENEGLTFMSIHDCYWTHPCTVEIMNQICRNQFIALHSEPILEGLSNFLLKEYGYGEGDFVDDLTAASVSKKKFNYTLSNVPKKGTFDLRGIRRSIYFFS